MKIVIDIPKWLHKKIIESTSIRLGDVYTDKLLKSIKNGTPLPITERYKPIILQEHDAEPRTMRAILDTKTEEIYVCKLTRHDAEIYGMTIEEVEE